MRDIEDVIARLSENTHRAGVFSPGILRSLAGLLPDGPLKTLETGCGNSTILFSNIAASHLVFAYDDRNMPGSSVDMVTASPDFRPDAATFVLGPTQATLPRYDFGPDETFDVILLDGPHGYPFPDLEYALLYPRLHAGSILIVDDIHIPSIGNMYDLLRADRMYDEVGVFASTGVLRRTADPGVPADGDHWYEQNYNISQFPRSMEKYGKARPVGPPGIVHFDSPSAVDTYGGRGVELAPGGGAARTIDSTATFLFQLSPCDARQQRVAITYRTIHAGVVTWLRAGDQEHVLPPRETFGTEVLDLAVPVDGLLRLTFVHENAQPEDKIGGRRYDFRRLGIEIRAISFGGASPSRDAGPADRAPRGPRKRSLLARMLGGRT